MGGVEFANLPEREQVRVLHRIGGRSFGVGATYLLGQLAAELGLTAALDQVFAHDPELKLLSPAFFRVRAPLSSGTAVQTLQRIRCCHAHALEGDEIEALLRRITSVETKAFPAVAGCRAGVLYSSTIEPSLPELMAKILSAELHARMLSAVQAGQYAEVLSELLSEAAFRQVSPEPLLLIRLSSLRCSCFAGRGLWFHDFSKRESLYLRLWGCRFRISSTLPAAFWI